MERIQALISKLKEQASENADASQMLITVQLLQNELIGQLTAARTLGTSKVAVVLPSSPAVDSATLEKYAPKIVEQIAVPEPVPEPISAPAPPKEEKELVLVEDNSVSIVQENGQLDMVFDPLHEIPTLSQQLTDGKQTPGSLNDKLKQPRTELMEVLKETPIKDLRKAIGINDRFQFINDLFRGDEPMYERSIKTINGFNIYPEAEYWITRELKTKLGWNPDSESVVLFDQLVRRRFS